MTALTAAMSVLPSAMLSTARAIASWSLGWCRPTTSSPSTTGGNPSRQHRQR
jgi:hypothetical protein